MSRTCIWDTLVSNPNERANIKIRSELMRTLSRTIRSWNITQVKAAKRLGLSGPRLNDLLQGKIDKFSLDTLISLVEPCGLQLTITVTEKTPE